MKFLSLLILFTAQASVIEAAEQNLPRELQASIERRIDAGKHPGIIIGIVDEAGFRYYGFGQVAPGSGISPDQDTIYEIGSIGKTFTGTLLADMVVSGDLKLDDPAQTLLPDGVTMPDFNGQPITLEHLATHRSSLPRMPTNFRPANPLNPFADYQLSDLYSFLASYQLEHAPGSERLYSNVGFGLLGHLLSLKSGSSYEELVQSRITAPLGMDSTAITLNATQQQRFAPPYAYHEGSLVAVEHWDVPTLAGAGALRSSAEDMLKYLAANLGLLKENPLADVMTIAQTPRDAAGALMGLGWSISGSEEHLIYAHNGGTGGFRSFAGFIPSKRFGVIVMTNSTASVDDIGVYLLVDSYPLSY